LDRVNLFCLRVPFPSLLGPICKVHTNTPWPWVPVSYPGPCQCPFWSRLSSCSLLSLCSPSPINTVPLSLISHLLLSSHTLTNDGSGPGQRWHLIPPSLFAPALQQILCISSHHALVVILCIFNPASSSLHHHHLLHISF
jgi:hypothetical protein